MNFNHFIIKIDFYNFLHIMVGQNTKSQMPNKPHFFISYDVMLEYICAKKV
jgi:hypothetical protein